MIFYNIDYVIEHSFDLPKNDKSKIQIQIQIQVQVVILWLISGHQSCLQGSKLCHNLLLDLSSKN